VSRERAWIAQTFLQVVLLSIIIVGQNAQAAASDARAQMTYEDAEHIKDQLDEYPAGGISTRRRCRPRSEAYSPVAASGTPDVVDRGDGLRAGLGVGE